ncbi:MAG: ABC transporter substrate-binding protein [Candidatus Bipolaricaulia bacterium]
MEIRLTRRSFLKIAGSVLLGMLASPRLVRPEEPLQISYPLSLAAFPLKFAIKKGIFQERGLEVAVVSIIEDLARRDAFIAGRLDGLICDVSTTVFGLANAGAEIAVTSTAFESVEGSRVLALMGSGPFMIHSLDDLFARVSGKPAYSIMLLEGSDMHFATDQLLASLGEEFDDKVIYIPGGDLVNIYTLLIGGSVLAAVLPEPLATIAGPENMILQPRDRATYLSAYEEVRLMPSVIAFQQAVLEERADEVELFYEAYRQAVEEINAAPREELLELAVGIGIEVFNQVMPDSNYTEKDLPEGYAEIFEIPQFPQPRALAEEEFRALVDWALSKRYISEEVAYSQATDNRFLVA